MSGNENTKQKMKRKLEMKWLSWRSTAVLADCVWYSVLFQADSWPTACGSAIQLIKCEEKMPAIINAAVCLSALQWLVA